MTLTEVRGIVIRTIDIGENDKLLTLLTEEKGKITAYVRGSRSMKSRSFAAAQLCCYSRFVLMKKNDRYYVQESELCENFFSIREDIERTALASYICDAVGFVAIEGPSLVEWRAAHNFLPAFGHSSLPQDGRCSGRGAGERKGYGSRDNRASCSRGCPQTRTT